MTPKIKHERCKTTRTQSAQKQHIPLSLLESLEIIYYLSQEEFPVTFDSIVKKLGLNKDLVTEKIFGLQGIGFLESGTVEKISLTQEGKKAAIALIRKHRLLERFLTDTLKLSWENVHEEAFRLAPVISDIVCEHLAKFLKNPSTCPHGNPIPSASGIFHTKTAIPLHKLGIGKKGVILRIEKEEQQTLKYLASLGLLPDTKVEIEEVAPFGGPLIVRIGSSRYAIGRKVAAKIFVKEG